MKTTHIKSFKTRNKILANQTSTLDSFEVISKHLPKRKKVQVHASYEDRIT